MININSLKKLVSPILKKHQVSEASVFGSFARGTAHKFSDIDLLIKFKGEKSLMDLAALKLELESFLGRKVDVVTKKALNPHLKKNILKEKIRIL